MRTNISIIYNNLKNKIMKAFFLAIKICILFPFLGIAQNNNIYNQLKQLEQQMALPMDAVAKLNVATFNGQTGKCTGLVTRNVSEEVEIGPNGKPIIRNETEIKPKANLPPSEEVELGFKFTNLRQGATLRVSGKSYSIPANATSYTVQINGKNGKRNITYSIRSGSKSYSDEFELTQSIANLAGAGAFTIPYLPVGLIYQPPLDREKENFAMYSNTKGIGATVNMTLTNDQSNTKAIFSRKEYISEKLGAVSRLLMNSGNPKAEALGSVLKIYKTVLDGLGTYSGQKEEGTETSNSTTFGFQNTQSESIKTVGTDGPGKDDLICFRKNVKVVWFHDGKQLYLLPIADDGKECLRAETLKAQIQAATGDRKIALEQLLALNPLAANPSSPVLPGARFQKLETYTINGAEIEYGISTTEFSSTSNSTSNYTFKIEDYRKGWLSYFGLGTTEDKTVKTKITQTSTNTTSSSNTVSAQFTLHAEADEIYTVDVYYDNLFKTFLLKKQSGLGVLVSQGVLDAKNELVTLQVNGQTYKTRTDANGKYVIYNNSPVTGKATLKAKGKEQSLDLKGAGNGSTGPTTIPVRPPIRGGSPRSNH